MKKIIKNNLFGFILGVIIFGSIGVAASQLFANDIGYTPKDSTWKKSNGEDITNVKDAIDELYTKANDKDNYDDKTYTQEGLSIFSNRVSILNGGYYIDNENTTWVNLSLKLNQELSGNDRWGLIKGLPNLNKRFVLTNNSNQYAFLIKDYGGGNLGEICYFDYSDTSLPKDTVITLQFKY